MDPLCTKCTPDTPCGKKHIYVIELDESVLKSRKFMKANPDYIDGKAYFYVGSTGHTVRCPFNQHVQFGDKSAVGFDCSCFDPPTFRYFQGRHPDGRTKGTRGNPFVGRSCDPVVLSC